MISWTTYYIITFTRYFNFHCTLLKKVHLTSFIRLIGNFTLKMKINVICKYVNIYFQRKCILNMACVYNTKILFCNGTQILVKLPNKEMSKEVENRRETQFDLVWGWKHAWVGHCKNIIAAIFQNIPWVHICLMRILSYLFH